MDSEGMEDDLRQRVALERWLRNDMSVRDAAVAGGCSNTTWSAWEAGDRKLGKAMRRAVTKAFNWPEDWPENLPAAPIRPAAAEDPTNGALLEVLEWMAEVIEDTNEMLRLVAKRQGFRLPAPRLRAPSPRALNAGRRKADRL